MSEKQVVKRIQPRDVETLHMLYRYCALSTRQLMRCFLKMLQIIIQTQKIAASTASSRLHESCE